MNYFKIFFTFIFILLITACSSTGTKDFSTISGNIDDGKSTLFFVGKLGSWNASNTPIKIEINGLEVGSVKPKEMLSVDVDAGTHNIVLPFKTLSMKQHLLGVANINVQNGEDKYFEVYYKQAAFGLIGEILSEGSHFGVTEVTKNQWMQTKNR